MARIKRITLITLDDNGASTETLYKDKKKKKKVSRWARPAERPMRKALDAADVFTTELSKRHRKSNRKRKDGFLRDGPGNVGKASDKAFKKLRRVW